jgi:hypothetical protein
MQVPKMSIWLVEAVLLLMCLSIAAVASHFGRHILHGDRGKDTAP